MRGSSNLRKNPTIPTLGNSLRGTSPKSGKRTHVPPRSIVLDDRVGDGALRERHHLSHERVAGLPGADVQLENAAAHDARLAEDHRLDEIEFREAGVGSQAGVDAGERVLRHYCALQLTHAAVADISHRRGTDPSGSGTHCMLLQTVTNTIYVEANSQLAAIWIGRDLYQNQRQQCVHGAAPRASESRRLAGWQTTVKERAVA